MSPRPAVRQSTFVVDFDEFSAVKSQISMLCGLFEHSEEPPQEIQNPSQLVSAERKNGVNNNTNADPGVAEAGVELLSSMALHLGGCAGHRSFFFLFLDFGCAVHTDHASSAPGSREELIAA
ncbi:hypothetical protein VPH35_089381 [Triticum aestivum]